MCWVSNEIKKQLFVLVKGNLQGATKNSKNSKNRCKLPICKKSFLESFQAIFFNQGVQTDLEKMKYSEAKKLNLEYNRVADEFYKVHKDWIRTDQSKYYAFS